MLHKPIDLDQLIKNVDLCKRTSVFQELTDKDRFYCTLQTPDVKGIRDQYECLFLGTKLIPVLLIENFKVHLVQYWECYKR